VQNNAPHYRQRAAEMRALADQLKHDDCRKLLYQVAAVFENLATCLEDRDGHSRDAAD